MHPTTACTPTKTLLDLKQVVDFFSDSSAPGDVVNLPQITSPIHPCPKFQAFLNENYSNISLHSVYRCHLLLLKLTTLLREISFSKEIRRDCKTYLDKNSGKSEPLKNREYVNNVSEGACFLINALRSYSIYHYKLSQGKNCPPQERVRMQQTHKISAISYLDEVKFYWKQASTYSSIHPKKVAEVNYLITILEEILQSDEAIQFAITTTDHLHPETSSSVYIEKTLTAESLAFYCDWLKIIPFCQTNYDVLYKAHEPNLSKWINSTKKSLKKIHKEDLRKHLFSLIRKAEEYKEALNPKNSASAYRQLNRENLRTALENLSILENKLFLHNQSWEETSNEVCKNLKIIKNYFDKHAHKILSSLKIGSQLDKMNQSIERFQEKFPNYTFLSINKLKHTTCALSCAHHPLVFEPMRILMQALTTFRNCSPIYSGGLKKAKIIKAATFDESPFRDIPGITPLHEILFALDQQLSQISDRTHHLKLLKNNRKIINQNLTILGLMHVFCKSSSENHSKKYFTHTKNIAHCANDLIQTCKMLITKTEILRADETKKKKNIKYLKNIQRILIPLYQLSKTYPRSGFPYLCTRESHQKNFKNMSFLTLCAWIEFSSKMILEWSPEPLSN